MAARLSMRLSLRPLMPACALLWLAAGGPLQAESPSILSAENLSAMADVRIVAADGEKPWTDGAFGKSRFGGGDDSDWRLRPVLAEATLAWQPRFSWAVRGTIVAAVQNDQQHPLDLVEAFLTVKPLPRGTTRFSARAGLYWPQVSMEHQGAFWSVTDMITPSAINSWIGEEVKVVGAEVTLTQDVGSSQLSATAGLFGFNDTAGTLIAFRGWALHDLKATAFGKQQLPPLNDFMIYPQAPKTRPLIEIDDRIGHYARLEWRLAPVNLNLFYYDNRGDPEAVTEYLQWGWDTKFWNLGARIDVDQNTYLITQALTGTTVMGIEVDEEYWIETRFRSAFLRATHKRGDVGISARYDIFDTRERGYKMDRGESEKGWSATADVSWKLNKSLNILGEVLHIDSKRHSRERIDVAPGRKQTIFQVAARFSF